MVYEIAVDSGKARTKAIGIVDGENKSFAFHTRIKDVPYEKLETEDDVLTLNGSHTIMASQNGTVEHNVTSKASDTHVRSTYYAISKMIPNGSEIALAIGTPLSTFSNPKEMNRYRKVMLNYSKGEVEDDTIKPAYPRTISFKVNGEQFEYTVKQLEVYPESTGYLMFNSQLHEEDDVLAVIDIGGLNVNASLYQRGMDGKFKPLSPKESETSNLGVRALVFDIRAALSQYLSTNITVDDAAVALQRGYYGIAPEMREETAAIIKQAREKHVENIADILEGLQWDFQNMRAAFVGGGSVLLREEIQNHPAFKYSVFSKVGDQDNVRGFLGAMMLNNRNQG